LLRKLVFQLIFLLPVLGFSQEDRCPRKVFSGRDGLKNLRAETRFNPKLNKLFRGKWGKAADFYIQNGQYRIPTSLSAELARIGVRVDLSRTEKELKANFEPSWCKEPEAPEEPVEGVLSTSGSEPKPPSEPARPGAESVSGQGASHLGSPSITNRPSAGSTLPIPPLNRSIFPGNWGGNRGQNGIQGGSSPPGRTSNPGSNPPENPDPGGAPTLPGSPGGSPPPERPAQPGSPDNSPPPERPVQPGSPGTPPGLGNLDELLNGASPPNPPTPSSAGKDQWIFLGDSLSVGAVGDGSKLESEARERWGREIEVINLSKVGKHTYEYKKEIKGILKKYPQAQYFPIFCGVNDVLHYSEARADKLRSWLLSILKAIQKDGRTPILMRITYRNYKGQDPLKPFNPKVYDPLIKTYSEKWYDHSRQKGSLDPHGFLKSNPQFMASDGVHLNSKGYKALRKKIMLEALMGPVYGGSQPLSPDPDPDEKPEQPDPQPEPAPDPAPPTPDPQPEARDAGPEIFAEAQKALGESSRSGPDGGNLACAWFVNKILKRTVGYKVDGDSTSNMEKDFQAEIAKGKAMKVSLAEAKPGDIILSPTVWYPTRNTGHVGIVGENQQIMSNSSSKAKWSQNFTYDSWKAYYQTRKGLEINIYRILK